MLNCEEVLKSVFSFLDKEMERGGMDEIQKHLDLCRECFSKVEFEQLLRDHLKQKTDHECPDNLKKRIQDVIKKF
jgi:mycothiol system anti-sigma-R factor